MLNASVRPSLCAPARRIKTASIACAATFTWLMSGASAHAGDDYFLINGGAETGDLTGWGKSPSDAPIVATMHVVETAGTVTPQAGDFFFSFADSPQTGTVSLYQGAPLKPGTTSLFFTGWIQTEFEDTGEVFMRALDGSGNVLASGSAGPLSSGNLHWEEFAVRIQVPGGATSWEVELRGTLVTGTFINVFYDSMFLSIGIDSDLNFDGKVDGADLGLLLGAWGDCAPDGSCLADLNGDRVVDGADLGILLGAWT